MKGNTKLYRCYLKVFLIICLFACLTACNGVAPGSPTISTFTADVLTIQEGENATLSWQVIDATSISIDPVVGDVSSTPAGSYTVMPTETTTYTLTASNVSGSVTDEITIIVGTEGMQAAIDLVIKDILPEISEVNSGDPYWCIKIEGPLPAGTVIEESYGNSSKAKRSLTLAEESYFFYLDLAPYGYFSHPVKYILVDKEGNHEVHDASWWPKIGGVVPEVILKDVPAQDEIIATNIIPTVPVGDIKDYTSLPQLVSIWREGFIVVHGALENDKCYADGLFTYLNMLNFLSSYQSIFSRTVGLEKSDSKKIFDTIDEMASEDRQLITIYIVSHGDIDTVLLGGSDYTVTQFRNKFLQYPDIAFNLILEYCNSGSFIDDLNTLDNVLVIETACGWNESSYTDYDPGDINSADIGSEWTSSLIEALFQIANDTARMDQLTTLADANSFPVTSMLIYQAGRGALGDNSLFTLNSNFDLTNVIGWNTPDNYCSAIPITVP